MQTAFVNSVPLKEFKLWDKAKRRLISFTLEITARCNNNCRHCYINLPANDQKAKEKELTFLEIKNIVDEAVSMGAVWCLITGGEPLLREDFFDIYLYLKKKGLLVSVFTDAALINKRHISLWKKYPPRDIEITVYGVSEETYEKITRNSGSYKAFKHGLDLLFENEIRVRFKAMALRSNISELPKIAEFCRRKTKDYFRFDPFLHLRFDRNAQRNEEIKSERLLPEEVVAIEQADSKRSIALEKNRDRLIRPEFADINYNYLFRCGVGNGSFTVSYDGFFRLCSSLWHPDCIFGLKKHSLLEVYENFVPRVRQMRSNREDFLKRCRVCPIINLCMWCPAHSYLETQEMDSPIEYFCAVAHARAEALDRDKKVDSVIGNNQP